MFVYSNCFNHCQPAPPPSVAKTISLLSKLNLNHQESVPDETYSSHVSLTFLSHKRRKFVCSFLFSMIVHPPVSSFLFVSMFPFMSFTLTGLLFLFTQLVCWLPQFSLDSTSCLHWKIICKWQWVAPMCPQTVQLVADDISLLDSQVFLHSSRLL